MSMLTATFPPGLGMPALRLSRAQSTLAKTVNKMAEKIEIKCRGATTLNPSLLKDFQGNLKSLSNDDFLRLKKQIVDLGFSEPISVWKHGKDHFILNGHQRLRTIQKMMEEGWQCDALPCNLIEAKTKEEAKRKLLSLTSQYGKMERQGLYEFLQDTDIKPEELFTNFRFPEIDLPSFTEEYFIDQTSANDPLSSFIDPSDSNSLAATAGSGYIKTFQLFFDEESHAIFLKLIEELKQHLKIDNATDLVFAALKEVHASRYQSAG